MTKVHIHPESVQLLRERLARLAETYAEGHFSILRYPTHWYVAMETPGSNLHADAGRESLPNWGCGDTLAQAVNTLERNLFRELHGDEDREKGEI